jgi:DNA-binding NarL/FixJ family response regulator
MDGGAWRAHVALIDDHPLFRAGLGMILRAAGDFEVVGEAGNATEARALFAQTSVDVAVVDVMMPEVSGISLALEIHELDPRCRVVGLCELDDPGLIADMLRAGACGFILKTQPSDEIAGAVRQVTAGQRYLPPTVSRDLIEHELASPAGTPLPALSRREREIFELVIRGYSNGDIAARLFISMRTVETHRQRVAKKLSARTIIELQRLAARNGEL